MVRAIASSCSSPIGTECPSHLAFRTDSVQIRVPRGIRTPVASVKGMWSRPLDDGDAGLKSITPGVKNWWSQAGSNRRPLACHASALPAELWPHVEAGDVTPRGAFRQGNER